MKRLSRPAEIAEAAVLLWIVLGLALLIWTLLTTSPTPPGAV